MDGIRVDNVTHGHMLVTRGRVAKSYLPRLRGLIGYKPLAPGEGLLILPSNSIHMFFMSFPIDVLYVDKNQHVVAMDQNMAPWRVGRIHRTARFVIELPAGAIAASSTQVGDQLQVHGVRVG